jgi:spore maturation protein CgeB
VHHQRQPGYVLLFHDTHHRSVTNPEGLAAYELSQYDGVLAYGEAIRDVYLAKGWTQRAWTWHEAADTRLFRPIEEVEKQGDLVWIGNWGDAERTAELQEFLLGPVAALRLRARVHGVRYPKEAREALAAAGLEYAGWLPNYKVPQVFAQFEVALHIPRRPYVKALPGIPTIRPFEALACGIPLVCSPWQDVEGLFTPGKDFLVARNGKEMQRHLRALLHDQDLAREMAAQGRQTILQRHTCAHRVDELLHIWEEVRGATPDRASTPALRCRRATKTARSTL